MRNNKISKNEASADAVVSVICYAYNHEKYIENTINGFLMQSFDYPFEVIIHDDASSDQTTSIIKKYAAKYPKTVKPVFQEINQFSLGLQKEVFLNLIAKCRGEYIAFCDGDDFWVDKNKLSIQYDFLERNGDCSMCCHSAVIYDDNDQPKSLYRPIEIKEKYNLADILNYNFIPTVSIMMRKRLCNNWPEYLWMKVPFMDWKLCIYMAEKGKIGYIDRAMGVYRQNSSGYWFGLEPHKRDLLISLFYSNLINHFTNREILNLIKARLITNLAESYVKVKDSSNHTLAFLVAETIIFYSCGIFQNHLPEIAKYLNYNVANTHPCEDKYKFAKFRNLHDEHESNKEPQTLLEEISTTSRKTRTLIFSDEPGFGGVGHYTHSLLVDFVRKGMNVCSAQPEWSSPLINEQKSLGVRHIWTGYNPVHEFGRSFTDKEDARRIINEVNPHVIFFSDCCPISHLAAKEVAIELGIPYVVSCAVEAPYLAERFPDVLPLAAKTYSYASDVVGSSRSVITMLRKLYGMSEAKGKVIYYGRPAAYFQGRDAASRQRLRAEFKVAEGDILFLTPTRVVYDKGHFLIIEALRQLKAHGKLPTNWKFIWIGEGDLMGEYREVLKKEGLDGHVQLIGYRWDLIDWLSAADVFLLTSKTEAVPLCVMEAMAKELPVVATGVAGVPEELGETGILLPDPNVEPKATVAKLVEVLPKLAADAGLREAMGQACHRRAAALFREEEMCRKTLELIQAAAEESPSALQCRKMLAMTLSGELTPTLLDYRKTLEKTAAGGEELPEFPEEEIAELQGMIRAWQENPAKAEALQTLLLMRQNVASFLTNSKDELAGALFAGSFGRVYRLLLQSGLQEVPPTEAEAGVRDFLAGGFDEKGNFYFLRLAASMLFDQAHRYPPFMALEVIPSWFLKDYLAWVFTGPAALLRPKEATRYVEHLSGWIAELADRLRGRNGFALPKQEVGAFALERINLIPAYCAPETNRQLMDLRGGFLEQVLTLAGAQLDSKAVLAPSGKAKKSKERWRVGVLNAHFGHQTETYVTLPAMHLDPERFEIFLFAGFANPGPVEDYCKTLGAHFTVLPEGLPAQVEKIRKAQLDVLIIGTNITAVTNQMSLLAAHRLAPVQILSHCSPMTSGLQRVDGFLSGSLAYREAVSEAEFREKLILLEGPPVCLDYTAQPVGELARSSREKLGLAPDQVIFFNAASCFKIPVELMQLWARLLAEVRDSILVLMPFNPNWARQFPQHQFVEKFREVLREHGVESKRVIFAGSVFTRAEVLQMEALADVYLDTMPFAGSISTVDPLELGIPVVACDGATTRSRCSGAQLREIGLPELVAQDAEGYLEIAVELGRNGAKRRELGQRIREAMAEGPRFLDAKGYGGQLSDILEGILTRGWESLPKPEVVTQRVRDHAARMEKKRAQRERAAAGGMAGAAGGAGVAGEMEAAEGGNTLRIVEAAEAAADDAGGAVSVDLAGKSVAEMLDLAHSALAAGRGMEVEDICKAILGLEPETAEAWALLGQLARATGDLEFATELFEQATALAAQEARYWVLLAETRQLRGLLDPALAAFKQALELDPELGSAWLGQAVVLEEAEATEQAEHSYLKAVELAKGRDQQGEARMLFARFLLGAKRAKEAAEQARRAVAAVPDSMEGLLLLGKAELEAGNIPEALTVFSRTAQKFPEKTEPLIEQGKMLIMLDQLSDAQEKLQRAVELEPQNGEALFQCGYVLQKLGRRTEALAKYRQAEAAGLASCELFTNTGVVFKEQERFMESARCFERAIQINPKSHAALNNLGAVCIMLGLTTEAIDCFQKVIEMAPEMPHAHGNLGHMLKVSGRAREGLPHYQKSLELAPTNFEMVHNYLLCTLYQTDWTPERIYEEHKQWGAKMAEGIKPMPRRKARSLGGIARGLGRIRVGYVSPDYCAHPVAYFAEAFLAGHDREKYEVTAYSGVQKPDEKTARFRGMVEHWEDVSELSHREFAQLVARQEIDILVDLTGHTALNRLEAMPYRPAPVTIFTLGYPATSGVPGVQYRLTDRWADPEGAADGWHTEKLLRMQRCGWCYSPVVDSPEVGPPPSERNGWITFGSFNNLAKLNPELYDRWLEILRAVPDSRLFLKAKTLIDAGVRKEVMAYFTERGIAAERVRVSEFEKKTTTHLDRYNEVDIALDSYPYHGTTTTCEALWMGVPVVSQYGVDHRSRVGVSLLRAVGHEELLAAKGEEYVRKAIELAGDAARLRELRGSLRGAMQESELLDAKGFMAEVERLYERVLKA